MSVWTAFVMFIFLPCALLKAHLSLRFMKYSFIIDFYPGNSSSYFSGCLCFSSFLSFFLYFKIIWYTCKQYVNGFYQLNWKSFDIRECLNFYLVFWFLSFANIEKIFHITFLLQDENRELIDRWMAQKAKDAEKLNMENDTALK